MEDLINCDNCQTDLVIIEDKLFYSAEKSETLITCPMCNETLDKKQTDGWFFIQTESEYKKEKEIERKKERLPFTMP